MGRPAVSRRGVTILPVVIALLFMFLLSALTVSMVVRALFSAAEASKRGSEEHSVKMKQWVKTYIYNVSLCKLLEFYVKALRSQSTAPQDSNIAGPVKILIANEGGRPVRIEHITVVALGSIAHEGEVSILLDPGAYVVYKPSDLGLPEDYSKLREVLDEILLFGGREAYNNTYFAPPPLAYVEVSEDGACSEP